VPVFISRVPSLNVGIYLLLNYWMYTLFVLRIYVGGIVILCLCCKF